MSAINLTSAAALQDHVSEYSDEIIESGFFSFRSLEHASVKENVKGKLNVTELQIGDLAKRKSYDFRAKSNIIDLKPRFLETEPCDIDFEIVPAKFDATYLGRFRQKGQNSKDIPFEAKIMSALMRKLNQELENAFWNAEETATPLPDDLMSKVFNGMLKLVKTLRTSGAVPPCPVSGGAYTIDNILSNFREMSERLGASADEKGIVTFGSKTVLNTYIDAYKKKHNGNSPDLIKNEKGIVIGASLENGEGVYHALPGLRSSKTVIATTPGNMWYGTDALSDTSSFQFKEQIKSIQFTTAFRIGVQLALATPEEVAVNDLS